VAWGDVAPRLGARVAGLPAASQARLQATAGRDVLVLFGAEADLPWVDGVAYAAPRREAPGLWLPTLWEPDVPLDLLERALAAAHRRTPLLLWPRPSVAVPLDRQRPWPQVPLAAWTERWRDR